LLVTFYWPDLIFKKRLMDLVMPEMDGICATKIIRQTNRTIPIVALTANATTDDRDECFEAGMNDFMTKPVSMEKLRKILESVYNDIAPGCLLEK
jgi:CheY-like chemotaxis protein